jgi:predicted esterase
MSATLPRSSDFPAELLPIIYKPPGAKVTNVVLFLPGMGDTAENFSGFARALNLPDTVTITLQPCFSLPFPIGPGQSWSDDVQFDQATGKLDADSPMAAAMDLVGEAIDEVLIKKHNFTATQIHLFGYGQGGSLALSALLSDHLKDKALGSIVSIGGPMPASSSDTSAKNRTPVLLVGGQRGSLARDEASPVKRVKSNFEFVEYSQWKKTEDSLPKNREEVLPMMHFLSRRLRSSRGVPDGAVEVT